MKITRAARHAKRRIAALLHGRSCGRGSCWARPRMPMPNSGAPPKRSVGFPTTGPLHVH